MKLPLRILCSISAGIVAGYFGYHLVGNIEANRWAEPSLSSVWSAYVAGLFGGAAFFILGALLLFWLLGKSK